MCLVIFASLNFISKKFRVGHFQTYLLRKKGSAPNFKITIPLQKTVV